MPSHYLFITLEATATVKNIVSYNSHRLHMLIVESSPWRVGNNEVVWSSSGVGTFETTTTVSTICLCHCMKDVLLTVRDIFCADIGIPPDSVTLSGLIVRAE